jgi:fumarate reductase subunit C
MLSYLLRENTILVVVDYSLSLIEAIAKCKNGVGLLFSGQRFSEV